MTGAEFKAIREHCGLTRLEWGRELGYEGSDTSVKHLLVRGVAVSVLR